MTLAERAPLVMHARVARAAANRVHLSPLRVFKADALHDGGVDLVLKTTPPCGPAAGAFQPGSTWVLALERAQPGWRVAACGAGALAVHGDAVFGRVLPGGVQPQPMSMAALGLWLAPDVRTLQFSAAVRAGQTFAHALDFGLEFALAPQPWGWEIEVRKPGQDDNLARLTPPLHFAPNPREIKGWHFLPDERRCTVRPYEAEAGPPLPRSFVFSPRVDRIPGGASAQDSAAIDAEGQGSLGVDAITLGPPDARGCPGIAELRFTVRLRQRPAR
ncbi:MAG: hypothetical protein Fur007_19620 [Rhodoferax sp.]